jgi:uncharacterized lipoprotein YajG
LLYVLLASGCAWTSESVAVHRQSVPVAAVPGATWVAVTVSAADARQEREISHKKNGYGMRAADITAANDVVAEVRAGVADILAAQGFQSGADATVRIELSRFYNTFDIGFWSATANAQATASLQVSAADGRSLYARVYNASHLLTGVQIMTADNAGTALRAALHALLRQIADDPQLTAALLQAKPTPPEPLAVPRPGRGRPSS